MFPNDQLPLNVQSCTHSNGTTKENIPPLTPIVLQPKDQEPNVLCIQDFPRIESEYLHPETEEDKMLVEDQEIEAYCRVG